MKNKRLIIGSRSSKLAMVQAQYVMNELKKFYPTRDLSIKTIKTTGDNIQDISLSKIGGKGLFTKEIEEALLARDIDLAVHSMKDLPTELPEGLKVAAVTKREDPRDVLVSRQGFTIKTLPKGSKVGTSSPRRQAQLMHIRKDTDVRDLRGNLDTRIKKMEQGLYDAIIVAYAGIKRMGYTVKLSAISTDAMLPQAGQGALGIEVLKDSGEFEEIARALDDADCHMAIDAERALLSGLEGGCQVPVGVYAEIVGDQVRIKAGVFSPDGKNAIRDEISGDKIDAEGLGRALADRILKNDLARQILHEAREGIR